MSAAKKTTFNDFMPEKDSGPAKQVVCTVPVDLKKAVQKELEKDGRTIADLVRASFRRYLNEKGLA